VLVGNYVKNLLIRLVLVVNKLLVGCWVYVNKKYHILLVFNDLSV